MKTIKLLVIAFLIANTAMAQKAILSGKVLDDQKQMLPGASVALKGTTVGTMTDANGVFFLNNVEAGDYTVTVSYIGFNAQEKQIKLEAGKNTDLSFELVPGVELSEIVVNSRLVGESKALNNQKNSLNITNMISYEQLERFPDANIGDAMKRMTGINVQYDQGEARFGNIRGTAPHLSTVTINGERIPSAEAEIRSVQLDLIPSDMIQAIEFSKAVTPDMDADAIGGSVNLISKSAPYKQEIKGKIGSGWNFISNKPSFKGNVSYSNRLLNDQLGIVLGASVYDKLLGSDNVEAEWENDSDLGLIYPSEIQVRQYYVERLRQSYSAALDYKFNSNHAIYAKGIYNHRNDWENRYRVVLKDVEYDENGLVTDDDGDALPVIERELKFGPKENKYGRLEDQRTMSFSGGGDHIFGKLKIDWSAAYSQASEERPDEMYLQYKVEGAPVALDFSNTLKPNYSFTSDAANFNTLTSEFEFDELTSEYQYTDEIDQNFKINFELPLLSGENSNKIKFGARYRGKTKKRENDFYEYKPEDEDAFNAMVLANLSNIQHDPFYAGEYAINAFPNKEISDNLMADLDNAAIFEKEQILEELAANFNAAENITAGYFMMTQNIGNKLNLMAGVRVEQTQLEYQGKIFTVPTDDEADAGAEETLTDSEKITDTYMNVLPGFHLKFSPNNLSNIRLAWTNTLARPNYYNLVPYQAIDRDKNEISVGNPELAPTTSMNVDLMYEYFFKNIGLFSAGVFYKDIKNVIALKTQEDYEYNGNVYDELIQPINISNATLLGFEAAFSRRLDFLPSVLKNLSFYGNYTYIQSEMTDIVIEGREDEVLPLAGSPKHTINTSLAYDTKKLDIRLSYNFASAFLFVDEEGISDDVFNDPWYSAVNYLDLNVNYKINKNFRVFADASNLLNQPLQVTWGAPEFERNMQSEYYGMRLSAGIKFNF